MTVPVAEATMPVATQHNRVAGIVHRLVWLLALVATFAGCNDEPASPLGRLPTVDMRIGAQAFRCEVAADESAREYGLMYRNSLPDNGGMIFVFPDEQVRDFWMKNTFIPLDIVYLDRDGKVVNIGHMKARDLNTTSSDAPAMYAIEVNAGAAARAGVKRGDTIKLPRLPQAK